MEAVPNAAIDALNHGGDPAGEGCAAWDRRFEEGPAPERARLCARLHGCAYVGPGIVEADGIDRLNIYCATMKAMTLAVDQLVGVLGLAPGHVLVDGNRLPRWGYAATAIVGGDAISLSIAAASIVAKHTRDTIMIAHAEAHPHYGWHSNKGYAAPDHLRALREHGPCVLHRRSFAPVAQAELPLSIPAESFAPHP